MMVGVVVVKVPVLLRVVERRRRVARMATRVVMVVVVERGAVQRSVGLSKR